MLVSVTVSIGDENIGNVKTTSFPKSVVKEISVEDGQPVEFGQKLLILE